MKPDPQLAQPQSGMDGQHLVQNLNRTAGVLGLLLLIYSAFISWYSWTDEKAESVRSLTTIVELEAKAIDSYFSHLETDLKILGTGLTQQGDRIDLDRAYVLVRQFKENHPELFNVTLIEPDGKVLLTAKSPPGTTSVSLAKESSFIRFIEEFRQGRILGIGQPLVGVVSKVAIVPVRYAIKDQQGNLSYIVSANLPHEHLRSFWMDAPITDKAAIGLIRDNGFLLSRYPVPANLSLQQVYGQPRTGALINHLQQHGFPEQGTIQGPSSLDGPDFLNVFRRLPHYPVTLFIAMPMSEIRNTWWRRAGGTYLALLFLLIGGFAAYRYALRRQYAWNGEQERLALARQQNELRFRAIMEASPVPTAVNDAKLNITYLNKAFTDTFGYDRAEIPNLKIWWPKAYPDPRYRQGVIASWQSHLDASRLNNAPFEPLEVQVRAKNGEVRTVLATASPLDSWSAGMHLVTLYDITLRKQIQTLLEEKMQLLATILDNSSVGITFVRERMQIWSNHRMSEMFGYTHSEMANQSTRMFYPSEEAYEEVGRVIYETLSRGELSTTEHEMRHKDGSLIWMRLSGKAVETGNLAAGSIWVFEDITRQMQVNKELQIAKEAAEAANIAKSRFLATMSHEIRTPMNGILGMAQMLLSPKLEDSVRLEYARTVLNSGHTLLALLNDILDFSKVEAGKIKLESTVFEPGQIIQETRALFSYTAAGKGLQIVAGESPAAIRRYLGDPYRLRQMLSNLVGNAIKFTREGQIEIAATEIEQDGKTACLEFSVTDTGVGIPDEKKHLLFQPFSQADSSTTRQFGGTGLGLSIVSSLAKLMGGKVGVDSQPGRGSRFWFRVQAACVEAGQDSRNSTRPGTGPSSAASDDVILSGRVLVAEDDRTNRKVAEALLKKLGLTAVFAEDGQQALDAITGGEPADLILMDVRMPVMDGFLATEKIRQWEAANAQLRRPIIALTADAFETDHQHCLAAGMDDFVAKPIAIDTLREVLGKWLPAGAAKSVELTGTGLADKSLDIPRIIGILRVLEPLLAQSQFDALRSFTELQNMVAGSRIAAEIDAAGQLLAEFRFAEARDCLRQIAATYGWDKSS